MSAGLVVTYDPNVLEIRNRADVSAPVSAMPLNSQFALTATQGTQWVHLINTSLVNWSGNGVVVNITFHVKSNAPLGVSPVNLAFTGAPSGIPANVNGNILNDASALSGSVNVTGGGGGNDYSGNDYSGGDYGGGDWSGGGQTSTSSPSYSFTGGSTYVRDSGYHLVISIQKDFSRFSSVRVNGNTLTRNTNYEARSGSTVVTLYASYLDTLAAGQHTLEVRFSDGVNVSAQFTIAEPLAQPQPQTPNGDIGFIGNPYPDSTSSDSGIPATSLVNTSPDFGRPPQTGVPDITGAVAVLCVSLVTAIALWACILRRVFTKRKNG
jgi:hypothetical protein